ncbi:hypothetical protein PMIN04_001059 [Paraphaeosphaeria minitans]
MQCPPLWCMVLGSLTLANPIFESIKFLHKPSSVTKTIVDTTTFTRLFDHNATNQNNVLSSGFSKAQSMIATTADVPKRPLAEIPISNKRRAKHELDDILEEPAYFTMVLLVNGYDVTVPILRENATDFCKSVSSKLTGGASGTTIPTDKDESTEAPKTSNSSEKYNPELETTESATRNTETDIPSSTVDPLNSPTKSRISATTSAQESDLPTDMPNSSESPSKSKYPTKKPSSTSPTKHTATVGSITTTEDDSALTTSSVDVEGKSHDVSQILADNSQAWASYSSYIEDLHSRLSKRVPNTQLDKITTTKEPKPSKSSTTSADTPPESKIKLVARQQRYTSQAAGMRGLIPRFRVPCVWRRIGLGYELHDTNEVEQVQGFSITSSRNKHKDSLGYHLHDSSTVEQVQGFSPKPPAQKREWTYNLGKGGELGIAKAQDEEQDDTETETTDPEPAPTTSKDALALTSLFLAAKIKVALHNQHAYISHANAHIICSSLDDWKRNARTS